MENNKLYFLCKKICSFLIKILYRPNVIGIENIPKDGPLIFAGNHRHAFDPVLVISNTNRVVHYMAKKELFTGLHGLLFKKLGLILVDRKKSNPLAIIQAENFLNSNGTVGIFPEGTRNKSKELTLLPFRHGTVSIAQKTGAPILPFAIKGKYKLFRKNITIEFGTPFYVKTNDNISELNKKLENEVLTLIRK